jgi:hypothetical protein
VTQTASSLVFRPATLDDATFGADMATALRPDEPEDAASWRHWWESQDPDWTVERFVVERDGHDIGLVDHNHAPWERLPKRYGRIRAEFLPGERSDAHLAAGFEFIEQRSRATGTAIYSTYVREDDEHLMRWAQARGYREERRSRAWELDLVARRAALETMASA